MVLGGSGFLGAHVLLAAVRRGDAVVSASRRPEPPIGAVPPAALAESGSSLDLVAFDAEDASAVARVLRDVEPDRVVLCSAVSRVADVERDPRAARRTNVDLPASVARWTRQRRDRGRATRLVHVSTDLVFGGPAPRASGRREDDPTEPRSEYGRTKRDAEVAVLAHDPNACVVRLPLLLGASFGRGLGASDAVIAAVARGERPALFTDEWRTPLDASVAARVLVRFTELDVAGTWHVGGPERIDRHTLGIRALRDAGVTEPERRVDATTRAAAGALDRPADVSLDSGRARSLLGAEFA